MTIRPSSTSTPSRRSCSTSITSNSSMRAPSCSAKQAELKAINSRLSTLADGVHPEAARGGEGRSTACHRSGGACRSFAAAARRRAAGREGPQAVRLCASRCRTRRSSRRWTSPDQPCDAPAADGREPQSGRAWRRQRHPSHHHRARAAPRQEGRAVRLSDLCRLHALRPDGEGPRDGARLPRPALPPRPPRRSGRNGPTSSPLPSRRARTSLRPRPTGTSTPSRSASSATTSTRTS